MNCTKCNAPLMPDDLFCPQCGEPAPKQQPEHTPAYAPVYAPAPRPKSNTGLIVAIIVAAIAVCVAIVAVAMIFLKPDSTPPATVQDEVIYDSSAEVADDSDAEIEYAPPVFDYVAASSTRSYDIDTSNNEQVYYYEDYVMDGDMTTAWTPDRNIDSVPSITLHAYEKQYVSGIKMTNGYCKSEKTYTMNRRISKVRVSYAGGETVAEFGMDHYRQMLDIPFGEAVETDYVTVQVLDTYYGEWKDIAISEIVVY